MTHYRRLRGPRRPRRKRTETTRKLRGTIAANVLRERCLRGENVERAAARLGVPRDFLRKVERAAIDLRLSELTALADRMGVGLFYLISNHPNAIPLAAPEDLLRVQMALKGYAVRAGVARVGLRQRLQGVGLSEQDARAAVKAVWEGDICSDGLVRTMEKAWERLEGW